MATCTCRTTCRSCWRAVAAARACKAWPEATAFNRSQVLYYLAENLSGRAEEFAARIAQLTGAGRKAAKEEVELSIERLFFYAGLADKFEGRVHQPPARMVTLALHEPVGVVGIVAVVLYIWFFRRQLRGIYGAKFPSLRAGEALILVAALVQGLDAAMFLEWLYHPLNEARYWVLEAALVVLAVPATLAFEALAMRLLGRSEAGALSRFGTRYVRLRLKTETLESAGRWLCGTLLWPVWLRAAGMRVGRRSEVGTLIDTVPEQVEIGSETFFADGIYLCGPRVSQGTVDVAPDAVDQVFPPVRIDRIRDEFGFTPRPLHPVLPRLVRHFREERGGVR